jgi:hypothetical protein
LPEFIPAPNLGPAEALARQANEMRANKPSPWAALLQGVAPYAQAYGKAVIGNYMSKATPPATQPYKFNYNASAYQSAFGADTPLAQGVTASSVWAGGIQ